jgi:hypothetical protein
LSGRRRSQDFDDSFDDSSHLCWSSLCGVEQRVHARDGGTLNLFDDVHIRPCRHRYRAVTKNALDCRCLDSHREQQRRARMTEVVEPDASHASSSAQSLERPVDVPRFERRPVLGREHQTECVAPCDLCVAQLIKESPAFPSASGEGFVGRVRVTSLLV